MTFGYRPVTGGALLAALLPRALEDVGVSLTRAQSKCHSVVAMCSGPESRLSWECPSRPPMTAPRTFGDLARHLRQGAGLSQRELAIRLGTTQSAVARLEAGLLEPRLATLERLALALGEDLLIHVRGKELA
jgi:ribosome-binding protein aMBF1 (putative translation factor)